MAISAPQEQEIHLKDYFYILRKRRTPILFFFTVVVTIGLVFTMTEKVLYRASSTILIERENPNIVDFKEVMALDAGQTEYYQTQYQMIKSRSLIKELIEKEKLGEDPYLKRLYEGRLRALLKKQSFLPLWVKEFLGDPYLEDTFNRKMLRVDPVRNSRLVQINIIHSDPARSAQIANSLVGLFIKRNLEDRFTISKRAMELISEQLAGLKEKVGAAQRKLQSYKEEKGLVQIPSIREKDQFLEDARLELVKIQSEQAKLAKRYLPDHPKMIHLKSQIEGLKEKIQEEEKRIMGLSRVSIDYAELEREAESSRQIYEALLKRLQETMSEAQTQASNIIVVDRAEAPLRPFTPRPVMNIAVALFLGMVGGCFLAFFLEYLDSTIKVPEDIERSAGLDLLGIIPQADKKGGSGMKTDLFFQPGEPSAASEALRALRTALLFRFRHSPVCKTILVTSPNPQEGKTTIIANLALAFQQNHLKVLLIDSDLRKPRLHKLLNVPPGQGITEVLEGELEMEKAIHSNVAGLGFDFLSSGAHSHHPTEILGSDKMKEFMDFLKKDYDVILIDSPPYLAVADVEVLSEYANAIMIISAYQKTDRRNLKNLKRRFAEIGPERFLGAVINRVSVREKDRYYQQYYYYGYGDDIPKK